MSRSLVCVALLLGIAPQNAAAQQGPKDDGSVSSAQPEEAGEDESWFVELQVGLGGGDRGNAYLDTLRTFHFQRESTDVGRVSASAGRRLHPHLALGVGYVNLDGSLFRRENAGLTQDIAWTSHCVGAFLQADYALVGPRLATLFARAGAGMSFGSTRFDEIVVSPPFPQEPFDPIDEDTE